MDKVVEEGWWMDDDDRKENLCLKSVKYTLRNPRGWMESMLNSLVLATARRYFCTFNHDWKKAKDHLIPFWIY